MSSLLALAVLLHSGPVQTKPIELSRKFTAGEKLNYYARAQFTDEERGGNLQTFIPTNEEINYHYTMMVQKVKADGVAEVLYQRPTMSIVEGDTAESSAKTMVEKLDIKYLLDISPINKIVSEKDLNPRKAKDKENDGFAKPVRILSLLKQGTQTDGVAYGLLLNFVGEIQRLAFFVGPVDSGLDIAPKFSFDEVSVGSTWKETVGYSPQKLKGQGEKQAVQRIDYTYTYQGVMKNKDGKDVHRVQAIAKLDTDLIDYARQLVGGQSSSSMFKSVPLKFDAKIDFDLEMNTYHMLKASAESSGSFSLVIKGVSQPYIEDRFKGRTSVKLEGRSMSAVVAPTPPKTIPPKKGSGGKH